MNDLPLIDWIETHAGTKVASGQALAILNHLQSGKSITPLESLELFGCFRLGARIWDLRHMGHRITKEMIPVGNGKRVACYSLEQRVAA